MLVLTGIFNCLYSLEITDNSASLSGFIKDSKTGETLIGATISLEGTKLGAFTNKNGYFSVTNIPPGEYKVNASFIGYEKLSKKYKFKESQSLRENILLKPSNVTTHEVQVEAEREVEKREISISKINVPIQQIKKIRIGGESDVFRSLQYLPGILTSSQISSGLFVRGGSPDQNLVLLDGAIVYNPSHLFGFISTFNSDAIKDVELIKGGFPAEYGGRLSAVLNLTQKDGNKNEIEGVGSIGAISSRLSVQGPLFDGSWFVGARRTYLELIKAIIPTDPTSPLPDFAFYDVNAKLTQNFGNDDHVSVSGFLSNDGLLLGASGVTLDLIVGNRSFAGNWTHIFNDKFFANVVLSSSYYKNSFLGEQAGFGFQIDNSINDLTTKISADWFISDALTLKSGFEVTKYNFLYYQNLTGQTDTLIKSGTNNPGALNLDFVDWNYAAYTQLNYNVNEVFSIQAGLRYNYWDISKNQLLDPRFALRYRFSENFAVKAAWGIFSQNLRLASQPDFSFFDTWLPTDSTIAPSRSMHYILSMETEPLPDVDVNFDVYYKKMSSISELNPNAISSKTLSDIFLTGNTESWGFEIFAQRKFGKFVGWIGYALGYINSVFPDINNGAPFRPKYDRRHDFKVVAQYQINEKWDIAATFTFQSGQSYTGATSRFLSRLPGQDFGRGKTVPSQRYGLRLPASHQLNLTGSYAFKLFGLESKVILDIFNVYNHRDIWFRYYDTRSEETKVTDVYLLPIIPTLSLEVKF